MARIGFAAFLAAAALAAPPARAQWRTEPMTVWLEAAGLDVVAGAQVTAGEDDLLVVDQARRTARSRRHHALLSPQPSTFPIGGLPLARALRGGYLAQNGSDGLADVASHYATGPLPPVASRIDVVFGNSPGTVQSFNLPAATDFGGPAHGGPPYVTSFLKLLARTPLADTLVLPYCLDDICTKVFLMDFDPSPVPSATTRVLPSPDLAPMDVQPEAFPAWISTVARGNGLDDVAIGSFGTVVLYAHRSLPGAPTLAALDLDAPVVIGTTNTATRPPWLPPTVPRLSEVRGVASLDVDFDGVPDLVFTLATPVFPVAGSLVWVKGTGTPAELGDPAVATWQDLGLALGLPDPMTVRPLRVAGQPAVAIWDRTLQEVLVVTSDAVGRQLGIWRAPAAGKLAKDIRLADVVGSASQDLLVVMDDGTAPEKVLVYADLGLATPALAWAPGSPGAPARGVPQAMAVTLDPGGSGSATVEWIQGVPTSAPVGTGLSHVFPPDCAMPPPPLAVLVRATDATGQFVELSAALPLASLEPSLALSGSSPPGRLVLPPGGTTAVLDGVAATGCGAASWGGTWPAAATVTDTSGPTWLRRTVVLPEAAYPELLADPAFAVSLATTDPGAAQPVATLALAFDGASLVELSHESDRTALAEGELAVVRTRLRSRISAPLQNVRVTNELAGLLAAGSPSVSGASLVSASADGTDLVLAALPPDAEVTITLPVRGTGVPGGSSAAARSEGGWPLTPAVATETAPARVPGCGCGPGSGPGTTLLSLLALALLPLRRRRRGAP